MAFTVEKHTAQMTGNVWFIVTEDNDGCQVEGTPFYDDHEDATLEAERRNNPCVRLAAHLGYGEAQEWHGGTRFVLNEHFAEQLLNEMTGD